MEEGNRRHIFSLSFSSSLSSCTEERLSATNRLDPRWNAFENSSAQSKMRAPAHRCDAGKCSLRRQRIFTPCKLICGRWSSKHTNTQAGLNHHHQELPMCCRKPSKLATISCW